MSQGRPTDTERLEWLVTNRARLTSQWSPDGPKWLVEFEGGCHLRHDWRDAIDAGMGREGVRRTDTDRLDFIERDGEIIDRNKNVKWVVWVESGAFLGSSPREAIDKAMNRKGGGS